MDAGCVMLISLDAGCVILIGLDAGCVILISPDAGCVIMTVSDAEISRCGQFHLQVSDYKPFSPQRFPDHDHFRSRDFRL